MSRRLKSFRGYTYLSMDEKFFSDRLRTLRNERSISAREMSLALRQNETYINKIENGQRAVSMQAFFRICDYLKVSPSDFFNQDIQNTKYDSENLIKKFRKLTSEQAEHISFILDELVK